MFESVYDFTIVVPLRSKSAKKVVSKFRCDKFHQEWAGHLRQDDASSKRGIHFDRIAVLPAGHGIGPQLMLSAVSDTPLDSTCLPDIWKRELSKCCDFPPDGNHKGTSETGAAIDTWLESHRVPAALLYTAAVGESVESVHHSARLKEKVEAKLNGFSTEEEVRAAVEKARRDTMVSETASKAHNPLRSGVLWRRRAYLLKFVVTGILLWGLLALVHWKTTEAKLSLLIGSLILAAFLILASASVFVLAWVMMLHWLGRRFDVAPDWPNFVQESDSHTSRWTQNSYTLLFEVRDGVVARTSIRLFFKLANLLIALKYQYGRLMGIGSIHFARFYLLNKSRRVLFLSDFDGASAHYLAEFAIIGRLAVIPIAIHMKGSPPIRPFFQFDATSSGTAKFSPFVHRHRLADSSSSAYKSLSVANVLQKLQFRDLWKKEDPSKILKFLSGNLPPFAGRGRLDIDDIQGLVATGYTHLASSRYLMLSVASQEKMQRLVSRLTPRITTVQQAAEMKAGGALSPCVNLGITARGLEQLGVDIEHSDIPQSFRLGSASREVQEKLGDVNFNGPGNWEWGSESESVLHLVVMLYGSSSQELDLVQSELLSDAEGHSYPVAATIDSHLLEASREHFGFRDGISQPLIDGMPRLLAPASQGKADRVAAGEFLLGAKNVDNEVAPSVRLKKTDDSIDRCNAFNSTFMVIRQLQQDVTGFWDQCNLNGTADPVHIASKLVGRRPNGEPLIPSSGSGQNNFTYQPDPDGIACPIGAHIRRANPRDSLLDRNNESGFLQRYLKSLKSRQFVNRHRILRRGRPYGPPASEDSFPISISPTQLKSPKDTDTCESNARGLMFVCLNADIEKQFEFIQANWMNSPKFGGLEDEIDAVAGQETDSETANFTIPGPPINRKIANLGRFVQLKGSGYYLLPGIQTLKWLAGECAKLDEVRRDCEIQ